ncbi:MAG: histidine phosphatase family protein [Bacteroidales bacterium]|nr:histidine phosphatase family protein [Bacteroidales bacterium]
MFGKKHIRNLILVRHGKAEVGDINIHDADRKLVESGRKETMKVAEKLKSEHFSADLIVTSDARRACETAAIVAESIGYPEDKIVHLQSLYLADEESIYAEIFAFPDIIEKVVLVGHNPGLTDFVNPFLDYPVASMETSAMVKLQFSSNRWFGINPGTCKLVQWFGAGSSESIFK